MPNIKSAVKRIRTSERNRLRNRSVISRLKSTRKKFNVSLETEEMNSVAILNQNYKYLDQAASKGVIHKNKAARLKSRMARMLNQKQA